jgi:hypothetical protein
MATSTGRKRVRFTLDVTFPSTECKDALLARLTSVRDKMTPPGVAKLDNYGLLSQLFSLAESRPSPAQLSQEEDQEVYSVPRNMLSSCGVYTGDVTADDQELFIVERRAFTELCSALIQPCTCWHSALWDLQSVKQKGHVLHADFKCRRCGKATQTWASSRFFGGHYLVNQKLVHAFTCAGILPRQYIHFSNFAHLGTVGKWYIDQVYDSMGYRATVDEVAELSMKAAVQSVVGAEVYFITMILYMYFRDAFSFQ